MKKRKNLQAQMIEAMTPDTRSHTEDCLDANDDTSVFKRKCICPKPSHTPTPRKLLLPLETDGNWIRDNTGQVIGDFISDVEPAFIVNAVNCHEYLVNALKQVQIIVDAQGGMDRLGIAIAKVLAKAEGK